MGISVIEKSVTKSLYVLKTIIVPRPSIINNAPPNFSFICEIINVVNRIIVGIECTKNPIVNIFTSRDNIMYKQIYNPAETVANVFGRFFIQC